jgi:hypothetical protein
MLKQLTNAAAIVAFASILVGFGLVEWNISQQRGPSANNQGQQTKPAVQKEEGSKPATIDHANGGQGQKKQ